MQPLIENPFTEDPLHFTMPLTLKAHQTANQFRQQQSNSQKAKQVYLNTLAVQTVQTYLDWFGIPTDLTASDSWNPVMQPLMDTADLVIEGGRLECRPVLQGESTCYVPPDVWQDRLGYVVVQLNADLTEATLLGFVASVTTTELALSELRSLEALLQFLQPSSQPESIQPESPSQNLADWFQGLIEAGWQTLESLLGEQQPALSFRNTISSSSAEITFAERGKQLELSIPNGDQIVLIVGVTSVEGSTHPTEFSIGVKVCAIAPQTHLPPDLDVMVLDETDVTVMQAQSRNTEMIQLKFRGTTGERFSLKITLGELSLIERFII
jgi:Protein of unknown function (DUF1822)